MDNSANYAVFLKAQSSKLKANSGQGALGFVFLLGGVGILVALVLAFLVISFINTSGGFRAANRALAAATAGVEDAVLRLTRNKDFCACPVSCTNACISSPSAYEIPPSAGRPPGTDFATVTVEQNQPVSGQVTIVSASTVSRNQKKVKTVASVSSSTGSVSILSWQQVL